jgi:hypothetical protein
VLELASGRHTVTLLGAAALLGDSGNPTRRGCPAWRHGPAGLRGHLSPDRCSDHDYDVRPPRSCRSSSWWSAPRQRG